MDVLERIGKLRALIVDSNIGGKVDSKKKMHKLVYLLQESGEDFDQSFVFHYYGVFSPSLARDLEVAVSEEWLHVREGSDDHPGAEISVGTNALYSHEMGLSPKGRELLKDLGAKEPRLLEALSTIVYLYRDFYRGQNLRSRLGELKPGLSSFYDDAFRLASALYGIEV